MNLFGQIIEVFILGLISGALPGPILTSVFTEVLRNDLKKGISVTLKALVAESIVAFLVLAFFSVVNIPQTYFYIVLLGGAVVLFWLARQVWNIEKIDNGKKEIFSFSKLFLLTLLNGLFWLFWITIFVPLAFQMSQSIYGGQFLFLLIFEIGWLLMVAALAFIFSRFRPLLLKKNLISLAFKIFALLLVFFGLKEIWQSVVFFHQLWF